MRSSGLNAPQGQSMVCVKGKTKNTTPGGIAYILDNPMATVRVNLETADLRSCQKRVAD